MAMLLQMLAGWWGAGGRSGRHYGKGGSSTPPYSTINYLLEAGMRRTTMRNKEDI
jgi:hypothetical protein